MLVKASILVKGNHSRLLVNGHHGHAILLVKGHHALTVMQYCWYTVHQYCWYTVNGKGS